MSELRWWQKAVFYQIYPRSFADGNGDGIGDLEGIIQRLDYLQDLGIDAIWLSPHYPSPLFDCGYDVRDYTGVAQEYGTLEDFIRFLRGAHERGMHVILDWVMNHTSHQHPWFVESRSSRDNPKRDWYVWRDGKGDQPPNNWYSCFGGPAWEYGAATEQYYYHFFLKEQPDLNWRNPDVQRAMFDAARFWLNLGVDGFRLDAIGTLFEATALSATPGPLSQLEMYRAVRRARNAEEQALLKKQQAALYQHQVGQPEVHDVMRALRQLIDEYPDRMLVGEDDDIAYYGDGHNELHLLFNFPLMRTERLTPGWVRANQKERLGRLPPGGWPCNTLGNHDSSRLCSRYGDGKNDPAIARLCLALMLTLRGTPFLYNGEGIGMTDLLLQDVEQFRDTLGTWLYRVETEYLGTPPQEAVRWAARTARDKCRTPMQWANAPNAAFSPPGVQTWLPVNPNYAQGINVAEQLADPASLLHFYQRLLRVRKWSPALIAGDYVPLHGDAQDYLAFLRVCADGQTCLVVLNMSQKAHRLRFSAEAPTGNMARLLFSSHERKDEVDQLSGLAIAPFEVYIGEVVPCDHKSDTRITT